MFDLAAGKRKWPLRVQIGGRNVFSLAHDLVRKPFPEFRDHALLGPAKGFLYHNATTAVAAVKP
jgi:hypothetical protein